MVPSLGCCSIPVQEHLRGVLQEQRMGFWERVGNESVWQKGACTIEFDRQCGIPEIQKLQKCRHAEMLKCIDAALSLSVLV